MARCRDSREGALAGFANEMARYANGVSFAKARPSPKIVNPISRHRYDNETVGMTEKTRSLGRDFSGSMQDLF
jgi:hypothetical protein